MKYLNMPEDGYVFIVTYGRSGSTLLQNLLNHIDGYCIRGENNNTLAHIARAWDAVDHSQVMRGLRKDGRTTGCGDPWYGGEHPVPKRYGQQLANVFVREILQPPPGTRVAGFKEIRFHRDPGFFPRYMTFLRRFFPRARFVFNTREHAAVMRSGWWAEWDPERVQEILTRAEGLYDQYLARFPDTAIRLRYEDYTANPDALRPLFDFLGEPWDRALVEHVLDRRLDHLKTPTDAEPPTQDG